MRDNKDEPALADIRKPSCAYCSCAYCKNMDCPVRCTATTPCDAPVTLCEDEK